MKIALIQICSKLDPIENLAKINKMILQAKSDQPGLEAVFLPEVFYSMSDGATPTPYLVEGENEHYRKIQNIAIEHGVYLLGGTAATKVDGKVLNRSFNFNPQGKLIAYYDKIHLFKIELKGNKKSTVIDEGKNYAAGDKLKTFALNGFHFGLSICFDLRFPELFRAMYKQGVNVISVSSAFTAPTGRAHWKILLQARAIENQSYIIACNQWGKHNDKLNSYGHSMVVDPWGEVVAECSEGEHIVHAQIDLKKINLVKGRIDMQEQFPT
jgi:predicted amidohydrolase